MSTCGTHSIRRSAVQFACPRCGVAAVVPVAYGMPAGGMIEAARRHEIILGGCCLPGDASHGCTACGWRGYLPGDPSGTPSGSDLSD